MNVKELKEFIKDLPDDMLVMEAYDGDMYFGVQEIDLSIESLYEWTELNTYGRMQNYSWIEPVSEKGVFIKKILCLKP